MSDGDTGSDPPLLYVLWEIVLCIVSVWLFNCMSAVYVSGKQIADGLQIR